MCSSLNRKSIVITGASGGIGKVLVQRCAEQNAMIGACYLNSEDKLNSLAGAFPGQITPVQVDIRSADEISKKIGGYLNEVGRCDVLINCAGIGGMPQFLIHGGQEIIREVIAVNLLGTIQVSQLVLQHMVRQRSGVILNISSVSSVQPTAGVTAYAASKGGVEAFTRAAALEYARRGIRIHCLRLGPVRTKMTESLPAGARDEIARQMPNGALMEPEEVAESILHCLNPQFEAISGETINLDGGYLVEHAVAP
jgi:3-oxoacyl-[acyl-carrier protein] reductase